MSSLLVGEFLQKNISRLDKVLLILNASGRPLKVSEIREYATEHGFRGMKSWNISSILGRSNGKAISLPSGWSITSVGKAYLSKNGLADFSNVSSEISDLREHLKKIDNPTTYAFVLEAIGCFEQGFFRSAIVMSWIAAVDILQSQVADTKMAEFNTEAKRVNARWKDATNKDGLSKMGEEDFLNRIAAIGVIGKNQKEELLKCLKLRNGCGHPNSLEVGRNTVAAHIEMLLLNVFEKF